MDDCLYMLSSSTASTLSTHTRSPTATNTEQSTHTLNTKLKTIKSQLTTAKEAESTLKAEIDALKASQQSCQQEKLSLQSSAERTENTVESLQSKITLLEGEKRRALESLEARSGDFATLRADLEASQAKTSEHRRVTVELEAQVQNEHAQVLAVRFREQTLLQETAQLKKSNEWLDAELKAKQAEHSAFRRDKASVVARLQAEAEQAQADRDGLRASLESARAANAQTAAKVDELLSRNKQLQDSASVSEEGFRREMAAQKRLAELYEKSAADAKARVHELETGGTAKLRSAIEQERAKSAGLEAKLELVEKQLAQLHGAGGAPGDDASTPAPSTPLRQAAGGSTPMPFSPSAKIVSELQRGGISLVQLYADHQDVVKRLERERQRNEGLQLDFDRLLEEMERHTPAILAERDECKRLESELVELSVRLEEATEARDKIAASSEKHEIAARDGQREVKLLGQQLGDASRQIQNLLVQQKMREGSGGPLTAEERDCLNGMLAGELDVSDTDRVISERLVVFADTISLQKQNERLLKISRELGQKLEAKEAETRAKMADVESAAIQEAHEALESVVADMERLQSRFEAVSRERDMFRRISGDKDGSRTSAGGAAAVSESDIESQWAAYKSETDATIKSLNDQISSLSDDRHSVQIALSKAESQCALLGERLQNLKTNSEVTKQEREQLRKRVEQLQEAATRQEIRTQNASEDVVEARSSAEQLRSEVANLQAEKRVWKSIEQRISKDNGELLDEKTRLNGVIAQMQVTESERSVQEGESRKRLVAQVEVLEADKSSSDKALAEARAELKKVSDRREIEQVQFQERVDALVKEAGAAREQVAGAKAESAQLKERAAGLESQVTSLTSQVAVLQRQSEGDEATQLGRLKSELAAVQSELSVAKSELATVSAQKTQFQDMARAAEQGLDDMVASHDEYKKSTDQRLAEREKAVQELEEQTKVLSEELKLAQNEIDVLQRQEGEHISAVVGEKKALLAQTEQLKGEVETLGAQVSELKNTVSDSQKSCSEYQANYEAELVKHAEAANSLTVLRSQLNDVKTQISTSAAEASSAKEQLENASESWEAQRTALEGEVSQLKSRVDDVVSQNKLLLDNLERRKSQPESSSGEAQTGGNSSSGDGEILTYLRQEKEIIETQYELANQENKRLQARLEHVSASLDEARSDIERLKAADSDSSRSETARQELADKMEQLSVFRESNKTLRMECEASNKEVARLQASVSALEAKLEPFENQLSDREAEIEAQKGEIVLLKEDNERWKARTQQILQRHERVDPAELAEAKANEEKALKALEEATAARDELTKELSALNTRFGALRGEAQAKINQSKKDRTQALKELVTTQEALKAAQAAQTAGTAGSEVAKAEVEKLNAEVQRLNAEVQRLTGELSQAQEAAASVADTQTKLNTATTQVQQLTTQLTNANNELASTKQELSAANAAATAATPAAQAPAAPATTAPAASDSDSAAEIEALKQAVDAAKEEAAAAKKEAEAAKAASAPATHTVSNASTEADVSDLASLEQLSKQVVELQQELAQKEEELKNATVPEALQAQISTLQAKCTQLEVEKKAVEDELASVREELKQAQESAAKTDVDGAPQSPPSDEAYRLQVREELLATLKKQYEADLVEEKAKWEAPLMEWRAQIRRQSSDKVKSKLTELNAQWEKTMAEKEQQLKQELEAVKASAAAEGPSSNPDVQAQIKDAVDKARAAEKKMAEMRQSLLVSKVAKLEQELRNTGGSVGGQAVPTAPSGATPGVGIGGIARPQTRIPGLAGRGGRGGISVRGGRGGIAQLQRPIIARPGAPGGTPTGPAGVGAAPFVPGAGIARPAAPTGPGASAKRPLTGEQPDAQKKRKDGE